MKKILIFLLALGSISIFAGEKLTAKMVKQLDQNGLLNELKVKSSKRVTSYYKRTNSDSIDVSVDNIVRTIEKEVLKVVVSKKINGIITGKKDGYKRLYVSFDSDCTETDCSYLYKLVHGKYDLVSVPKKENFCHEVTKSGVILRKNALKKYNTSSLEVGLNDQLINNVIKRTERLQGH
jgi:hypothetical protein